MFIIRSEPNLQKSFCIKNTHEIRVLLYVMYMFISILLSQSAFTAKQIISIKTAIKVNFNFLHPIEISPAIELCVCVSVSGCARLCVCN